MAYSAIIIFFFILILFSFFMPQSASLSRKVLYALIFGISIGSVFHLIYSPEILHQAAPWFSVVGDGYILFLQMVVVPLVFSAVLSTIGRLYDKQALGKIATLTILILLITTAIAAAIGIFYTLIFHLSAANLTPGVRESNHLLNLHHHYLQQVTDLTAPAWLLSLIPVNPIFDLAGMRPTSIISVVIFAIFLGIAVLEVEETHPIQGKKLQEAIEILQLWAMKLVRVVLRLTPYGIFALMISMISLAQIADIQQLALFIIASYYAIITMFAIHYLLLRLFGVPLKTFWKKTTPLLIFAFISRSSAASIPMNIEIQTEMLSIPKAIASFTATLGATIGQNGCAGIYPAMLATMTAPAVGINITDPVWIVTLIGTVTLSAVGVAGVGGGATFAALIVLTILHLPITVVALLISIEPLIDMGRTALNVNGTLVASGITSRLLGVWSKENISK